MWCRHCQQDVPVVRQSVGAPACPRCRASLAPGGEGGVELESFDPKPARRAAPFDPWVLDGDAFELRRIGRRLRPCVRPEAACVAPAPQFGLREDAVAVPQMEAADRVAPVGNEPRDDRVLRGGLASVAADSGFLAMIAAAATMAAQHEGMIPAEYWRWGAIGAGIGAAVFAFGVLRLATLAWQHGRALDAEIDVLRGEVTQLREACEHPPAQPRPSLVGADVIAHRRAPRVSSRVA